MAKIDLAGINRDEFNVSERGEFVLVTPQKSKHVWEENELHLRSLLCRHDGTVVSSGFPKFVNYGEKADHDEAFRIALSRNAVEFAEKLDGSLIIVSYYDGAWHLRTRGNHNLGDFDEAVRSLIETKYPHFWDFLNSHDFMADALREHGSSLLFEYVGPDNRIVVPYSEPALYFLGELDSYLVPHWGYSYKSMIADPLGVPMAPVHDLPKNFDELMQFVKGWQDKEGVVARFVHDQTYRPMLLKIKASQYVKLHALKFKLQGKAHKLAFLLGAETVAEAVSKFMAIGLDHEGIEFVRSELEAYEKKYLSTRQTWENFRVQAEAYAEEARQEFPDTKAARKAFVEWIRRYLAHVKSWCRPGIFSETVWFQVAMQLYDGKKMESFVTAMARLVMDESPVAVSKWLSNPMVEVDAMLSIPVSDD